MAGELHVPLLILDVSQLPDGPGETDEVLLRAFREASLHDAMLCLDNIEDLPLAGSGALAGRLAGHPGVVILASDKDWVAPVGPPLGVVQVCFLRPGPQIRRRAWEAALSRAGITAQEGLTETLADRFRCEPGQIADAVTSAAAHARAAGTGPGPAELFAAARRPDHPPAGRAGRQDHARAPFRQPRPAVRTRSFSCASCASAWSCASR